MYKIMKHTFLKAWLGDQNLPDSYKLVQFQGLELYNNENHKPLETNNAIQIVQDIPDYLTIKNHVNTHLKLKKVITLKGHIIQLKSFNTLQDYLLANFNTKSRNHLKRYVKKLEACFPITYKSYMGTIDKQEYHRLFVVLKQLLIKRFEQKQELNYELQHLEEFEETMYDLIIENKANLFVIYHANTPISIRINLFKKQVAYYMISAYDIDYSKFHLGSIDMLKNIEWCINQPYKIYDLLKGYNEYKSKWANRVHQYYLHILYNPKQKTALLLANVIALKEKGRYKLYSFYLKHRLDIYHKQFKTLKFKLNHWLQGKETIRLIKVTTYSPLEIFEPILWIENPVYAYLKEPVYSFLFANTQPVSSIQVLQSTLNPQRFLIQGITKSQGIEVLKIKPFRMNRRTVKKPKHEHGTHRY